jgi:hypothetical protein
MIAVAISALGILVVLVVLADVVDTTLRVDGGGWLTRFVMTASMRALTWRRAHAPSRRRTRSSGALVVVASMLTWMGLLWFGWLLVFLPHAFAVVSSTDGAPADFWSRVYFAGYSVITLGVGDFAPRGAFFQVATVASAITGFFLVTLSVTYVLALVSAVVESRQLAARVFLVGDTPNALIENTRVHEAHDELVTFALGLVEPIALLTQRHYAFPVLRLFRTRERTTSSAVAIAMLDEALTILLHGVRPCDARTATRLDRVRNVIARHVRDEKVRASEVDGSAPPVPSLDGLREVGVPLVDTEHFRRDVERLASRRRLLKALVRQEDWTWEQVVVADAGR